VFLPLRSIGGKCGATAKVQTDSQDSVQVSQLEGSPRKPSVSFIVPNARQMDVVDHIYRKFRYVEDYCDLTISFDSERRRRRRYEATAAARGIMTGP